MGHDGQQMFACKSSIRCKKEEDDEEEEMDS